MLTRRNLVKTFAAGATVSAALAESKPLLSAHWFGAKGNAVSDDTTAIQNAINEAATKGAKVFLPAGVYQISQTLQIPGGVILVGDGWGDNPLSTMPSKGTVLHYVGTDWALSFEGHTSGARDLVVAAKDSQNSATGGIYLNADGRHLESLLFNHVLIYGFTAGTALKLYARQNSGIAYCSFYDVRVRHAKVGIHIEEIKDSGDKSFVNSNSFYHGAVSGGGFDYCLLVDGGNNNIFHGTIMEPYTSTYGHLVVNKGWISCHGIRIEASNQPTNVPMIEFKQGTSESYVDGLFAAGLIINRGSNTLNLRSGKAVSINQSGQNLFANSAFKAVSSTDKDIPEWQLSDATVEVEVFDSDIMDGYHMIKLTVPAGINAQLSPTSLSDKKRHDQCNFGAYVKTDAGGIVFTSINATDGLTVSGFHPGDNEWHLVGMSGNIHPNQNALPKFWIDNSNGTQAVVVYLSNPTFTYGIARPQPEASPLTAAGGQVNGTLMTSMATVSAPADHFLLLPRFGNIFEVTGTSYISRINHTTAERFPKGTVITLLFAEAGLSVQNGAYLKLRSTYLSTAYSTLTLVSLGDGTWRELWRNV